MPHNTPTPNTHTTVRARRPTPTERDRATTPYPTTNTTHPINTPTDAHNHLTHIRAWWLDLAAAYTDDAEQALTAFRALNPALADALANQALTHARHALDQAHAYNTRTPA